MLSASDGEQGRMLSASVLRRAGPCVISVGVKARKAVSYQHRFKAISVDLKASEAVCYQCRLKGEQGRKRTGPRSYTGCRRTVHGHCNVPAAVCA